MKPLNGTARVRGSEVEITLLLSADAGAAAGPDPPPAGKLVHGADFAAVKWGDQTFSFTPKQRLIVAALVRARRDGHLWLSQEVLLEAAESECGRLRDLFRGHPAWGVMVVSALDADGPLGSYRLADPPG